MEINAFSASEQAGNGSLPPVEPPQWLSPDPPISRQRALEVALNHAEAVIGGRGGPGLHMRVEYILKHARQHNLDARLYEVAWFIERTTRDDHMIADNGANPISPDNSGAKA